MCLIKKLNVEYTETNVRPILKSLEFKKLILKRLSVVKALQPKDDDIFLLHLKRSIFRSYLQ